MKYETDPAAIARRSVTLLSTVVTPRFAAGNLRLMPVAGALLDGWLAAVTRNLCGHPVTDRVLRAAVSTLPVPERAFWDGQGMGLAVRPKGGVRNAAAEGDTSVVSIEDLEAVLVEWIPAPIEGSEERSQREFHARVAHNPYRVDRESFLGNPRDDEREGIS